MKKKDGDEKLMKTVIKKILEKRFKSSETYAYEKLHREILKESLRRSKQLFFYIKLMIWAFCLMFLTGTMVIIKMLFWS